jgi:hypothetical protein
MSIRDREYWSRALLLSMQEAEGDSDEEWFFFHWFWMFQGVKTIYE